MDFVNPLESISKIAKEEEIRGSAHLITRGQYRGISQETAASRLGTLPKRKGRRPEVGCPFSVRETGHHHPGERPGTLGRLRYPESIALKALLITNAL
ncbi:hypothetical protein EVAR_34359_1 [Eumeta japonica]|uniref:Uncharacterized protein n=1 Tax=Eumeta variegata TaxID=151549 RepID=A0A4C2A0P8_EUMVA|nr:hypothetical protein EVAR_34359_1 [Eumeta japonica]